MQKIDKSCFLNSDGLKVIYQEYQKGFGQLSGFVKEMIDADAEEYTVTWVCHAMYVAIENNKRRWSYVRGILKRWAAKYTPTDEVEPWLYQKEVKNGTSDNGRLAGKTKTKTCRTDGVGVDWDNDPDEWPNDITDFIEQHS